MSRPVLADTSIWVEFLRNEPRIAPALRSLLEENRVVTLDVVGAELLQGARDERERSIILSYWENLPRAVQPDPLIEAGLRAGRERLTEKGVGIVDAVLLQAAHASNARVWTLDRALLACVKVKDRHT